MSSSSAPFAIASRASTALTIEVVAPSGNPMTVQTLTSVCQGVVINFWLILHKKPAKMTVSKVA